MNRFLRLQGDKGIWAILFLLALVSLLAVYSSTSELAYRIHGGDTEFFFLKHVILLAIGFVLMFVVHRMDYRLFAKLSNVLLGCSIVLLAFTIFQPGGNEINQTSRWLNILGFSFQPSDMAKFAIVVFISKMLAHAQEYIKDFYKAFLPIVTVIILICGLIAPGNLSTALLIFATGLLMMYIAGIKFKYLMILILAGLIGGYALSFTPRFRTWNNRIEQWTQNWQDDNPHYQNVQANIAIARGGMFGQGAGKSIQRNTLPQPHSDFIFAIIVEEYGFLGGLFVLGLYVWLLLRAIAVATLSRTFGGLMTIGFAFMLTLQALINMGVTTGVLPVTGLPLPLVSLGGTSILFTCIMLGVILSVSRTAIHEQRHPTLEPA